MRIKIVQKPRIPDADGIRLDLFEVGFQYEVGNSIGALLLAEGWAVPVSSDEPGVVIPFAEAGTLQTAPHDVVRAFRPEPQVPSTAADKRRKPD